SPDSIADLDGRLQVGDILLKVNETFVSGLSRQTVIDLLRKAQGTVQLTVCRSMALHWAYSGNQSNNMPSPPNTKAEPDSAEGSLEAPPVFTFMEEDKSNQMCTKGPENIHNSPLQGEMAGREHIISDISDRSRKYAESEGCGRGSQQSETDSWNNEDNDLPCRISTIPRSKHGKPSPVSLV
ncbi:PARD3 protein, partial [Ceuthmochares aereus]|nr:PARD3 protein [Ceuthmochares aereus]